MPARILPHGTPLPDDHPLRMGMMITPIPRKPAMATPDAAVLFESNPVLAAEWIIRDLRADPVRWAAAQPVLDEPIARLFHAGHGLPEAPLRSWAELGVLGAHLAKAPEPWRPGVLGLVHGQLAECVVPLEVEPAPSWRIAPRLPLAQDRLVDLLVALLHEAKRLEPGVLPEARAFVIETKFPWSCSGTSMDVAAVLAILRRTAPPSPLLDRACAVVEPEGSRLRPVAEVEAKLRAFVRECGRGSLLVRHPDCRASAAVAASFDHVWDVPDLATLAAHLAREGWFDAWTSKGPHGLAEAELVLARLRSLQQGVPDHRATVQFARRALSCTWSEGVPPAIRQRPRLELLRSLRHLGSYADALQVGEQWLREVHDLGEASCTEQLAEADLEFAAGLFDLADFERMHAVLRPWLQRIDADPLGLSPVLRTRLWNTAARALVQLGREGWEALFLRSLALQAKTEPGSMPRTRNYLVEGLLRNGRLDDAAARIAENEQSGPDAMSSAMLRFHRAELSRRRGLVWVDPAAECEQPDVRRANHPLGLYLQATARQPGRTAADAVQRFAAAGACFAFDAQRTGEANVLWVLARSMELAAALGAGGDASAATRALATALAQPGLEKLCARLGPVPSTPSEVEPFLAQLPWT